MNAGRTRVAVAELTAALTTEFDVPTVLHAVARHARACFDAVSAVVILLDERHSNGDPEIQLVAEAVRGGGAADPRLHMTGPGPASARNGVVATIDDLDSVGDTRWPDYRQWAIAAGIHGVRAFPVTTLAIPLGSVVVHTDKPWGTARSNDFGQVLADLTAIALSSGSVEGRRINTTDTIEAVLQGTTVTAIAVGILAEYFHIPVDQARDRLIRLARAHDVTPTAHARAIITAQTRTPTDLAISGLLQPPPDLEPPRPINS